MCITVVGSINTDIVALTDDYPLRGETIFGKKIEFLPGGKGGNQATAVAKLGEKVNIIGSVGQDLYGDNVINTLKKNNVTTKFIKRSNEFATGTAIITIDQTAENTMLVLKGANDDLLPADIENAFFKLQESKVLLVQMEVPQETVIRAMQIAKEKGMYIILDPAPAEGITMKALEYADVITPNRQETKHMIGIEVNDIESALHAARTFEKMGVKNSIIKMAEKGSLVYQSGQWEYVKAIPVKPVDTVGAGDAFAGALACGIATGKDLVSAVEYATIVGALKVTKLGAQTGIPTLDEVNKFCEEKNISQTKLEKSR
ncbi:ribokinase [Aquibacillus sp. 3ASR75-11]|uniref:Ribokinase n=1 Tax=Terrihalobacillus insolitus TaxID=2950438 RepID=A0A9X3WTK7_9BACI|nr:ribokinase [Terrihalobacillus insolitus]MDC3424398.1 ribokinase [Terrihalobacillus insolitus]